MAAPTFFEVFVVVNLLIILFAIILFQWQSFQQRNITLEHLTLIHRELEYLRTVSDSSFKHIGDLYLDMQVHKVKGIEPAEPDPTPTRAELLMDEED